MFLFHIEITNRDPVLKPMELNDVSEHRLVLSVCHKHHLQVLIPIFGYDIIQNGRKQLTSFLDRIEAGRPKEDRCLIVPYQAQPLLEGNLVLPLGSGVVFGSVWLEQMWIIGGIKGRIRCV